MTVTDANVILGRLPTAFLSGRQHGDCTAQDQIDASPVALDPAVAEHGSTRCRCYRRVNNNMEQAIRLISIERGHDVRDFTLVCFGGAGALHAATLAADLGNSARHRPAAPGCIVCSGTLAGRRPQRLFAHLTGSRQAIADADPEDFGRPPSGGSCRLKSGAVPQEGNHFAGVLGCPLFGTVLRTDDPFYR